MIFLLILAVTLFSVVSIERGERAREEAQVSRIAGAAGSALERRATINAAYLRAGAALFALQPGVDKELFRRFVSELRLDSDYRGAEGIGWAAVVREGPRVRVPVTYLQPETARNRRALGFDMYADPTRRAAMQEAERTVRPTASGRVVLAQEGMSGSAPGFLIYVPVFDDSAQGRRLRGFIYSPYNSIDFIASAGELVDREGMRLALYDGEPSPATLLGTLAGQGDGKGATV